MCVPLTCNICAAHALRVFELEVEVEHLRGLLVPPDFAVLCRKKLGIKRALSTVLSVLAKGGPQSREHILSCLSIHRPDKEWPEGQIVDVYICHLRKALCPHGLTIQTINGFGYEMASDHIERLKALVEHPQTPN